MVAAYFPMDDVQESGCLLFLIAVIGGIWIANIDWPFSNQTDIYTIRCEGAVVERECTSEYTLTSKFTATVLTQQQAVVLHSGGTPSRWDNCIVADRANWSCETTYGDDISNQDGQFKWGSILGIPKWRWWLERWLD